ncbi:MAG: nitrate reductase subunit alpha [Halobacteriovoraceae bacterium]|nr:nitrate reductase subunit alpha [Halobacteriovoraceae bacterium]
MSWIDDIISPKTRLWEEFYRNRFQHDKVVRSTHGVNCTGSCSWNVCVKDGIVTWELQAVDYPLINNEVPPYEPRGCQRGISFSWYLYSPIRIKYPYVRGALMDIWRDAKRKFNDPVEAWQSIQSDKNLRKRYQKARGKGGFRRASWDEMLEIISASNISTVKKYGPDRITGFSPIPAMSQISYAAGARFLQLMGGVNLSFYDWYCDLPPASPETWGEQTDVAESADWYNSKMVAIMGANLNMTRTPDCHFIPEARTNGSKVVVFSPDFSQVAKFGDEWVPLHAGSDCAFWMAVNHVLLKEFHSEKKVPYFLDYQKKYTDNPFLIELVKSENGYRPGKFFRGNRLSEFASEEHGDWKFLVIDEKSGKLKMPKGTIGHRHQEKLGQWNLEWKDSRDDSEFEPKLSLIDNKDEVLEVEFLEFGLDKKFNRGVPVKRLNTVDGEAFVTTVYDLMMAQYGVSRGLDGDFAVSYDEESMSYTPAWQERFTGIGRETVIKFARDWGNTARDTNGKCSVIIGAGIDHWYHNNLMYRAPINALILCGCIGVNGGGLNHYVGQEKLAPAEPWGAIAFAKDWQGPVRLQNSPSWHYMHTDQWRYDGDYDEINSSPEEHNLSKGHTADLNAKAVRNGWLPFFPQYKENSLDLCSEAQNNGANSDEEIKQYVFKKITSKEITPAIEDIDAEESFPRVWYIWRGNAIGTSSKGHEYFLNHYLGTHTNKIAEDCAQDSVKEIKWYEEAPTGKMDLVIDINFRMDTSALYSDIVLPAASWYEKFDLNTTDMHSFIHPLAAAIPPVWESKSDWQTFREIAKHTSELAKKHFGSPVKDIVSVPLQHDSIDELSQPEIKDWAKGECEPVLGKSMYKLVVCERDYTKIYDKYCTFGPLARNNGIGAHGVKYDIDDFYDKMLETHPTKSFDGNTYPSLYEDIEVCNTILHLASVTNGELAYRAYKNMEKKTGLKLADLAEKNRSIRMNFKDIQAAPKRLHSSPVWSGLMEGNRTYSAFTYNVERMVPWRTLTGRQSLYLDHEGYIAFGENLPTYKPSPSPEHYGDLVKTKPEGNCLRLNYLTPHGKWHIHSTYGDTLRMLTLSRGAEPFWMSPEDAKKLDIVDNDYVEVFNDHGVIVTRANVSARIPPGVCIVYHATERTYSVPKSPIRGNKRAGMNNSLTRVHLKPNLMVGGYAQFTYHFNYWGPTGVNRDTHILVRKLDNPTW